MPDIDKKTLKTKFKAIKLSVIFGLALFLGLFFVGGVSAGTFTESFETYNLGNINYQGDWFPLNKDSGYNEWGFEVTAERASEGFKGIKSHPTSTDLLGSSELWWATTTGTGIFSFDFIVNEKPNFAEIDFCKAFEECLEIKIGALVATSTIKIKDIILAENYVNNSWHRISFEYNLTENWGRYSLDFSTWSATTTIFDVATPDYFNRFVFRSGGQNWKTIYFDNFTNIGECNSTCIYCSDVWSCENFEGACNWNYTESQCQSEYLGPPELELPPVEDCSILGVTDRLLCEVKNFFYRLFVPSSEKIGELRGTLDLIKNRFPYNYVVVTQDFFTYLRENIDEEQPVNFKVFNQAGVLNFAFWDSTTTLAGTEQSFMSIFKKFSIFLVILIFMLWCFSFLKRIFK